MKKSLYLSFLLPLCLSSCSGGNSLLKDIYKDYFTIGAAFNENSLTSNLVDHFNSLTCENEMKWISLHPSKDIYTFETADKYVAFAKEHNMGIRGHTLVWHHIDSIPADVFDGGKEKVLENEKEHIEEVVKHFGDSVYCWDVVNEVIDTDDSPLKEDGSNIYYKSKWFEICGEDFVKEAYLKADEVLKELGIRDKVQLFYNDFENAKKNKKDKTIAMIKSLQAANVPIDGIGLQCHYHLGSFDPVALEQAIIDYHKLGLRVHITEFDCEIYDRTQAGLVDYETYSDVPQEALDVQATIYDRAFEIFRKHKDKIDNVTFWGISDDNNYMNDNKDFGYLHNYPFVFDYAHEHKPAYDLIANYKEAK